MRPDQPFDRVLLVAIAGAGALVGHGVGYSLGAAAATTDHGHLSVLAPAATGVAGGAALVLITRWARRAPGRPPYRSLVAGHVLAYLLLEIVEAALSSPVAHLSSPGFLIGLLAQPLVAWVVARALTTGADVLRAALVRSRRRPARAPRAVRFPAGLAPAGGVVVGAPRHRRGPPLVVAS
ncbi:MAG: hypothetical protein AAGA99_20270 [Actinomycetota bacterium]